MYFNSKNKNNQISVIGYHPVSLIYMFFGWNFLCQTQQRGLLTHSLIQTFFFEELVRKMKKLLFINDSTVMEKCRTKICMFKFNLKKTCMNNFD